MDEHTDERASDAIPTISAPANRALAAAGYTRLSQLAEVSDRDLLALHGFGPKGLRIIREALQHRADNDASGVN